MLSANVAMTQTQFINLCGNPALNPMVFCNLNSYQHMISYDIKDALNLMIGNDNVSPLIPLGVAVKTTAGNVSIDIVNATINNADNQAAVMGFTNGSGAVSLIARSAANIKTTGARAYGLYSWIDNIDNSAMAKITSMATIITTGKSAYGLYATTNGTGATMASMNSGAVNTFGEHAYGVYTLLNNRTSTVKATATTNNAKLKISGDNAKAVFINNLGLGESQVEATASHIEIQGESNSAIEVNASNFSNKTTAKALLSDSTIIMSGSYNIGVYVITFGLGAAVAEITADSKVEARDTAENAIAILSVQNNFGYNKPFHDPKTQETARIISAGTVVTQTDYSYGLYAKVYGRGNTIAKVTKGRVQTQGENAHAIYGYTPYSNNLGTVTVESAATISTIGSGAYGLYANSQGLGAENSTNVSIARITAGSVTTQGAPFISFNGSLLPSHALYSITTHSNTSKQALAEATGGTVTTIGDYAAAVYAYSVGSGATLAQAQSAAMVHTHGTKAHAIYAHIENTDNSARAKAKSGGIITTGGDGSYGLYALSSGKGMVATELTSGKINTTGAEAHGIYGFSKGKGGKVDIKAISSTISTSGDQSHAILAQSNDGIVTVDLSDVGVTSLTGGNGTGAAIRTETTAEQTVTIMIGSGDTVAARTNSGFAIQDTLGKVTVTLMPGANIDGQIDLGAGTDALNINQADISGVTGFDGGAGTGDTIIFYSGSYTLNSNVHFAGWEATTLNDGVIISGAFDFGMGNTTLNINGANINNVTLLDAGLGNDTIIFSNGTYSMVANSLTNWQTLKLEPMTQLTLAGVNKFTTLIHKNSILNLANSISSDRIIVGDVYTGGGTLVLDADFSGTGTADRLMIATANGNSEIIINILVDATAVTTGDGIKIIDITHSNIVTDSTFTFAGDFIDNLTYVVQQGDDNDFYLIATAGGNICTEIAPAASIITCIDNYRNGLNFTVDYPFTVTIGNRITAPDIDGTVHLKSSSGDARIDFINGDLDAHATDAFGISVINSGTGAAIAQVKDGYITTVAASSHGVYAHINNKDNQSMVTINNAGTIITTGAYARGLSATTVGLGDVVVKMNSGLVQTSGANIPKEDAAYGVYSRINNKLSAAQALIEINGGTIITHDDYAHSVFVANNGFGTAKAMVSGDKTVIKTGITNVKDDKSGKGNNAYGVYALSTGKGAATAKIKAGVKISTTSHFARGVIAQIDNHNSEATALVNSAGIIRVVGFSSDEANNIGLYATTNGLGTATVIMSGGAVQQMGNYIGFKGSYGIYSHINNKKNAAQALAMVTDGTVITFHDHVSGVFANSNGVGEAKVVIDGANTMIRTGVQNAAGTASGKGKRSHAVIAMANGTGMATAEIKGGSTVNTLDKDAYGVIAVVNSFVSTATAMAIINNARVVTMGYKAHAVHVFNNGGGKTIARLIDSIVASGFILDNNDMTITAVNGDGRSAHAVYAYSAKQHNNIKVEVSGGKIIASGKRSHGIFADSVSGTVEVDLATDMIVDGVKITNGATLVVGGKDDAAAIFTKTSGGRTVRIKIGHNDIIDGMASGFAIVDGVGDARLYIGGGKIIGAIIGGPGKDDQITFQAGTYKRTAKAFSGWEVLTLQGSAKLTLTDSLLLTTLTHSSGILKLEDNDSNDMITVKDTYTGGGTIVFDVDFSGNGHADKLVVNSVHDNRTTTVAINILANATSETTGDGVLIVDIIGTDLVADSAFVFNKISSGNFDYTIVRGTSDADAANNFYLRATLAKKGDFCEKNTPDVNTIICLKNYKTGLTFNVKNDIVVTIGSAIIAPDIDDTVQLTASAGDVAVNFINGDIYVRGSFSPGISVFNTGTGSATITVSGGLINVVDVISYGIFADISNSNSTAKATVNVTKGSIITHSRNSTAVVVRNKGSGEAKAMVSGANTVIKTGVLNVDGTPSNNGDYAYGVYVLANGNGAATAEVGNKSTVSTLGISAIAIFSLNSQFSNDETVMVNNSGMIKTSGEIAHAMYALSKGTGMAVAKMTSGSISTLGLEAFGIYAHVDNVKSMAPAAVQNAGIITTVSDGAYGIYAKTNGVGESLIGIIDGTVATGALLGDNNVIVAAADDTGRNAHAVYADSTGESSGARVEAVGGEIMAYGQDAHGIFARSNRGHVTVDLVTDIIVDEVRITNSATLVTGGQGDAAAIRTNTAANQQVHISIGNGDRVMAGSDNGFAVQDGNGNAVLMIFDGATLNGRIDGGAGFDQIIFDGGTHSMVVKDLLNWESIELDGDSTIATIIGDWDNAGTINLQDDLDGNGPDRANTNNTLIIDGEYSGNGVLLLDVNFATGKADKLVVNTVAVGTSTTISINVVADAVASNGGDGILIVDVTGEDIPDNSTFKFFSHFNDNFTYAIARGTSNADAANNFYLAATEIITATNMVLLEDICTINAPTTTPITCLDNYPYGLNFNVDNTLSVIIGSVTNKPNINDSVNLTVSAGNATVNLVNGTLDTTADGVHSIFVNNIYKGADIDNGSSVIMATGGTINAAGSGSHAMYVQSINGNVTINLVDDIVINEVTREVVTNGITSVTGGRVTGAAIRTDAPNGTATIMIGDDDLVRANTDGFAIQDTAGEATVILMNGADIDGGIDLGAGTDSLNINGADVSDVNIFNGGDGAGDAIVFNNGTYALNARFSGWEIATLNNGATINGVFDFGAGYTTFKIDGANIEGVTGFNGGAGNNDRITFNDVTYTTTAANFTGWEALNLQGTAHLTLTDFTDALSLMNVTHSAGTTLSLKNFAANDVLTVSETYIGGGTLALDVDFNMGISDSLVTAHIAGGATTVMIAALGTAQATTGDGIKIVNITGNDTPANTSFELAAVSKIIDGITYSIGRGTKDENVNDFYVVSMAEVNPNPNPISKPDPKVNPEPNPIPKPDPKVNPNPNPILKPEPKVNPNPNPILKPEPKVNPNPNPILKPEPKVNAKTKPNPKSKPKINPEPKSKPDVNPEPKPKSKSKPDPNPTPDINYPATNKVYTSIAAALQQFNNLSTYEQRLLNRRTIGQGGNDGWVRIFSKRTNLGFFTDTNIQNTIWGIQGGVDFTLGYNNDNQWILGVNSQYSQSNTSSSSTSGSGNLKSIIYGFGVTATWQNIHGAYIDSQLQFNWLDGDISINDSKQANSISAKTYIMSAEVGHKFVLGSNTALIPQAQITWERVDSDKFIDDDGRIIQLYNSDRVVGRLGLAYKLDFKGGQAYIIGNLLHNFSDAESTVIIDNHNFTAQGKKTWSEVGIGGSVTLGTISLSAKLSYQYSFSDFDNMKGFNGSLNINFYW